MGSWIQSTFFVGFMIFFAISCGGEVSFNVAGCDNCPERCLQSEDGRGRCVRCLRDEQCQSPGSPTRKCTERMQCICGSDKDCPTRQYCLGALGCVECITNEHCKTLSPDKPICVANRCGACAPKQTRPCPQEGANVCKKGTQTCKSSGTWGSCEGALLCQNGERCDKEKLVCTCKEASPETCNGKDDDCDGQIDNGLSAPPATKSEGVCQGQVQVCKGSEGWQEPDHTSTDGYEPTEKTCDGKDNDCDGQTDEDWAKKGTPCTSGIGACERSGTFVCTQDGTNIQCSVTGGNPSAEKCDGIDNDCDGQIDNGALCPGGGECREGACVTTPTEKCIKEQTCVLIKAGAFLMGSPSNEPIREKDEGPQHKVTITRSFYMMKHEVTQGAFQGLMGYNPSGFGPNGTDPLKKGKCATPDCPVERVSWHEAAAYANALSLQEGLSPCFQCSGKGRAVVCSALSHNTYPSCRGWRLPTEAEWEYAARAATTTPFYTGTCLSSTQANVEASTPYFGCPKGKDQNKTVEVGGFPANAWGLFDMAGNVWEWTYDRYANYSAGAAIDPVGPTTGSKHVNRGGSWGHSPKEARSANRTWDVSNEQNDDLLGFRIVKAR